MKVTLKIWRQESAKAKGALKSYKLDNVEEDMSFLEMLDMLNEELAIKGERTVEYDHDCREGICGQCSLVINGQAHGPESHFTTCQTHMRSFKDGDTIFVEPFRANSFPVIRDANNTPIHHNIAESAFDSAACIGCGACVATCKNSSAALFVAAKVGHLAKLPQGQVERMERVIWMVDAHDEEGFGSCTNTGACAMVCPQEVELLDIARMNFEYNRAMCLKDD